VIAARGGAVRSAALGARFHLRVVGLVLAAAGLLALLPMSASAGNGMLLLHSAASGELQGKRLTLRGVGRHVTWVHNGGRSGRVAIRRMHRRIFIRTATGTLHVAGHRGGQEPAFRLSRPRYNAARKTVSYRVRRLNRVRLPGRAAGPAQNASQFGAASLSIVPHAQVMGGDNGGNDCGIGLVNETGYGVQVTGSSKWDTDSWDPAIPGGQIVTSHSQNQGRDLHAFWQSDGGLWRGCSNTATWQLVVDPNDPTQAPPPAGVTFTFNISWPWGSGASNSCSSSNPQFYCIGSATSYFILRGPVPCCMTASTVAASRR
jgi:hypothetical protein